MKNTTHKHPQSSVTKTAAATTVLKGAFLALALACGIRASAQTSTTTTNFTDGRVIPDASASGLASTKFVSTPISQMTDLNVTLKINGTFNGDLYAYLTHSSGRTVLLNRAGKRASSDLGYGDDGLNVTFDDSSTNGDAHIYRYTINGGSHNPPLPAGTPWTGVWSPDGRTNSPLTVLDTDTRAALLNSFNGLNPNGEWVLFVADLESGDVHTLDNWGLEITGYTSPAITANPVSTTSECSSGNAAFSVTATGSNPLSYQWRHGGSTITGATNSTLTIPNATFADAGNYDVVVSSPYGSVTGSVAVLTIQDTTAPSLTCPNNITVNTAPGQCSASVAFAATASDTCGAVTKVYKVGATEIPSPYTFAKGTTTVDVTATDEHNNSSFCSFTVTVEDHQNPTISAPAAVVVNTDAGQCSASSVALGTPIFGDNCPGSTVANNAPASFPKGLTVVIWTVTDASGNTATATQNVTVNDTEVPTITCPANVTAFTTNSGGATVSFALPNGADNCGVQSVVASPASGSNFPIGTTPVTVTVTDTSGNTAQCSFNVTVVLNSAPVAGNDNMGVVQNQARSVKIQKCISNDFDADDDALTVIAVSNGAHGTATFNGTQITYTPAANYVGSDAFTYTISDGRGGLATATITVEVYSAEAATPNMLPIVMNGSIPTVRFAGIPGFTYTLERTPTLSPAAWQQIGGTITVPANGIVEYPDMTAPAGSAFYRTVSQMMP
jgi:subtilisin-like proprotein convertase family protein